MLEASVGFSGVVPILEDLLEPPNMKNVSKSFDYLHYAGMITVPADEGALTSIGRLAGNLPVDLQLGRLIAYGVALGKSLYVQTHFMYIYCFESVRTFYWHHLRNSVLHYSSTPPLSVLTPVSSPSSHSSPLLLPPPLSITPFPFSSPYVSLHPSSSFTPSVSHPLNPPSPLPPLTIPQLSSPRCSSRSDHHGGCSVPTQESL